MMAGAGSSLMPRETLLILPILFILSEKGRATDTDHRVSTR